MKTTLNKSMTGPCHDVSWLTTARTLAFTDIVDLKLGGRESARRFAKRIDARIKQTVTSSDETGWAIAALGGYGRREMAPQSDVDLLFLVGTGNEDIVASERTSVLQMLWNAGLKVGHATRNLMECAELAASDPTVATAHIDARHIAGDTRLVAELVTQSLAVLQQDASSFSAWLRADAVRRHQRYGDTVYYLEPNLKLGEGGLRDAQTAKWAATVAFGIGYGLTPSGQERIPARVTRDLETGHDFLLKLRIILHQETGFRGDRLTFEAQEKVAKAIGYTCGTTPDTRRLMQETYRHCQRVFRATQRVLDICDAHTTAAHPSTMTVPLSGPFITQGSYLSTTTEIADPGLALQLLSLSSSTGLPIHPDIHDTLQCRAPTWNWADADLAPFWDVLTRPDNGDALFDCHHAGVLCAIIPDFSLITGLFQRNIFHTYTVDVHSLHAIVALKRLLGKKQGREIPPGALKSVESQPEWSRITAATVETQHAAPEHESDGEHRSGRDNVVHERWSLSELFDELRDFRPLFLATLLHDIGKGVDLPESDCSNARISGKSPATHHLDNHISPPTIQLPTSDTTSNSIPEFKLRDSERFLSWSGNLDANISARVALRIGLSKSQADDVAFLVKRHLDMAVLSQQRDLGDVAMIRAFSREVGSIERLNQLTLLTYADMAAVHPQFLTQWRESLLVKLYHKTRLELEKGESSPPDEAMRLENVRIEVLKQCFDDNPDVPTPRWRPIERFLGDMPRSYLLSTSTETIVRHLRVLQQQGDSPVKVAKYALPEPGLLEIVIVTQDKPGLLLLISGVMASCGLDIVGADVVSRADGSVIDVFTVSDPHGDLIADKRRMSQLDVRLSAAIAGQLDVDELVRQELNQSRIGPRPVPQLRPEVGIDSTVSRTFTVIDVSCTDQRALLYRIAKTLTDLGLTIGLSRVSTVGHEARDTFYITYISGQKITENGEIERIRRELIERLSAPAQQI